MLDLYDKINHLLSVLEARRESVELDKIGEKIFVSWKLPNRKLIFSEPKELFEKAEVHELLKILHTKKAIISRNG